MKLHPRKRRHIRDLHTAGIKNGLGRFFFFVFFVGSFPVYLSIYNSRPFAKINQFENHYSFAEDVSCAHSGPFCARRSRHHKSRTCLFPKLRIEPMDVSA